MDLASSLNSLSLENSVPKNIENFAAIIGDYHTEFVLCCFQNCLKYIITQFGKIGNFYSVNIERPENGISVASPIFNVVQLFGSENINAEVSVRYLAERLNIKKPLLVSLTLKNYNKEMLDAIIEAIKNYKPQ